MKPPILFLIICLIFHESAIAKKYADLSIEKLLPKHKQTEMGLKKLTSKEREKLHAYLIEIYFKGIKEGRKQVANTQGPPVIESRIDGSFDGWDGETIVKLMNGQIWQQFEYYYYYHYAYMPEVLIYKSNGVYKMKVEGIEKSIGVIRLK